MADKGVMYGVRRFAEFQFDDELRRQEVISGARDGRSGELL